MTIWRGPGLDTSPAFMPSEDLYVARPLLVSATINARAALKDLTCCSSQHNTSFPSIALMSLSIVSYLQLVSDAGLLGMTEMALTAQEQTLIETRIANDGPSTPLAYLFWFFLGGLSAHRFYLGYTASAVVQLLLNLVMIGLIWTVIDVFLIPGLARKKREEMRQRLYADSAAQHKLDFGR